MYDHAFDRLRKIERTINEIEHSVRALSVRFQREAQLLTSSLTEIRRAVIEVKKDIEEKSGYKDPAPRGTIDEELEMLAAPKNPVENARGAGLI